MMYDFLKKFEAQAKENPFAAVLIGVVALKAVTSFVDTMSSIKSKNAYANDRKLRAKNQ